MPVEISKIEPGIYRAALSGTIQLEELVAAQTEGARTAIANGDERYVLVMEVDPKVEMPFDLRQSGKIIEANRAAAILIVGASLRIRFLTSVLGGLFRSLGRVENVNSSAAAVKRARQLLGGA